MPGFTFARLAVPPHGHLNHLLRERLPSRVGQDAGPAQMPRLAERFRQTLGERHVSDPAAVRHRDVAFPVRTRHAQLSRVQRSGEH